MRARFLVIAVLGVVALAGCGGGDDGGAAAGGESAATVVPASALAYVSINADLESDQWQRVERLAEKFPGRDRAVDAILAELGEEGLDWKADVDPALGPEVALAVLPGVAGGEPRLVLLTQPDDEDKLKALLRKTDEPTVSRELEDWWLVAEKEADLDAFESARASGTLADDESFGEATADLPDESVASFYVDGEGLQKALERAGGAEAFTAGGRLHWIAGALEALDAGARLSGAARIEGVPYGDPYTPRLLERVPAGSLLVASFSGVDEALEQLRSNPFAEEALPMIERTIGITLTELAGLFRGEGVLYVRRGAPVPEITLALEVDDEAGVLATVDRLAGRLAPVVQGRTGSADVGGVSARYLEVRGVRITYATFDGLLFLTSGTTGLADFRSGGEKLAADDAFTRTKDAAGLGDETSGFLYVDLHDALALIQGLAGIAGESVPPDVSANLTPLDTLLVYASKDADELGFTAYVGVR